MGYKESERECVCYNVNGDRRTETDPVQTVIERNETFRQKVVGEYKRKAGNLF